MPFLFNVASQDASFDSATARVALHWALAGTRGAETVQHIDAGGCATAIHVLSGRKLWIVGIPEDGADFTNSSHMFQQRDDDGSWDCMLQAGVKWEAMVLGPGDTLSVNIPFLMFDC